MTVAILGAWVPSAAELDIRVQINAVLDVITLPLVPGRPYWVSADGTADSPAGAADLLTVIQDAIAAQHTFGSGIWGIGGLGLAGTYGETVVGTATADVEALWADALTTFPPWVLGFASSNALLSGAAPGPCPLVWRPGVEKGPDTLPRQDLVRGRRRSISGKIYTASFGDAAKTRQLGFSLIQQDRMLEFYSGPAGRTAFETIDRRALSLGRPLRFYEDEANIAGGTGYDLHVLEQAARYERTTEIGIRYNVAMRLRAYA